MIFLAGVYVPLEGAAPVFRHVPAPTGAELQELVPLGARAPPQQARLI